MGPGSSVDELCDGSSSPVDLFKALLNSVEDAVANCCGCHLRWRCQRTGLLQRCRRTCACWAVCLSPQQFCAYLAQLWRSLTGLSPYRSGKRAKQRTCIPCPGRETSSDQQAPIKANSCALLGSLVPPWHRGSRPARGRVAACACAAAALSWRFGATPVASMSLFSNSWSWNNSSTS